MWISDISIKRPVLACVVSLLLVVFGLLAFARLPLREFPDIDPPIVTIRIDYPGAAAHVVESRITEIVEDRIAGIEGIESSFAGPIPVTYEYLRYQFDVARTPFTA